MNTGFSSIRAATSNRNNSNSINSNISNCSSSQSNNNAIATDASCLQWQTFGFFEGPPLRIANRSQRVCCNTLATVEFQRHVSSVSAAIATATFQQFQVPTPKNMNLKSSTLNPQTPDSNPSSINSKPNPKTINPKPHCSSWFQRI